MLLILAALCLSPQVYSWRVQGLQLRQSILQYKVDKLLLCGRGFARTSHIATFQRFLEPYVCQSMLVAFDIPLGKSLRFPVVTVEHEEQRRVIHRVPGIPQEFIL